MYSESDIDGAVTAGAISAAWRCRRSLLLGLVGGVATTLGMAMANQAVVHWIESVGREENVRIAVASGLAAVIAAAMAGAAWLHWRRFTVPIIIAAGAMAVGGVAWR